MRTTSITLALLSLIALAGCAPGQAPDDPGAVATQEPVESEAPCIEGRWSLDLEDYSGQAAAYLKSIGILLESLAATGTQILDIDAGTDPVIGISTDITWDAVILGNALTVPSASSGQGEWGFGETDSTIEVDNWAWFVEPGVPAADAPVIPLFEPGDGFEAQCSGDTLSVRSPDAPLTGNFIRVD
jgi:hypothetical protein